MNRILLIIGLLLSVFIINAQVIISDDTMFCSSQPHDLYAMSAEQSSMSQDDQHDVVVPIGFDFDFYGGTYDKCVVSGNGYITFDTSVASTWSPYSINQAIPNPGSMPENAILAPWQDIDVGVSGSIYYGTTGIAPNRRFTVTWCAIAMYSCNQMLHTSQAVLHEGSNKIEMFIQDKPLCITWNGGAAIQGLVDATSTNFDIVDDPILLLPRNWPLTWTATNEGWEFLPNGTTSYNINAIAYQPIIAGLATWTDAIGTVLGTGPILTVNPTNTTTYYCSITGSCAGVTLTDSVTIAITGCFGMNLTSTPSSCSGTDGTVTVAPTIIGVTTSPPWTIELQDFNGINVQVANNVMTTTHTFSNVVTGPYIVKITQTNGYSAQDTIIISQIQNPLIVTTNHQDVNCYGGSNGVISVIPQGSGASPYQFYINGSLATNPFPYDSVFTSLSPGVYIMSVIDTNNCMDKDTVVITQPNFPLQISPTSNKVNCHGEASGFSAVSSTGGTPSYNYEWFDGSYTSIGLGDSITGLLGGSYFVKVTDANGCEDVGNIQILQMQTPLLGNNQIFGVPCKYDSTGMIVSQAVGSQGPYRYYWFNPQGDSLIQPDTDQFLFGRDTLADLPTGVYDLHLYDANGCTENYTITVGEPTDALSIDSVVMSNMVRCYGEDDGAALAYVSGGMPNYYFMWDNGELNSNAVNLTSGYHVLTLTDDWGCVVKDSVYVNENTLIETTISVDNEVSCYGLSDGSVSATSVGGSPNYTYFWSNLSTSNTGTSSTNSGLIYGSYYLTTQDIYGCEVFDTVLVLQPDPLNIESDEIDSISCYGYNDGLAYAYAWGGTSPYTFYWDSLSGFVGDTNGMLTPGVHTVFVVDDRGCISSDTVLIHEPPVFEVNIIDGLTIWPYCIGVNSASLTSEAIGGTPFLTAPYYSYVWDDNPVTPQTTPVASSLLAGVYTVTVTDSRGCVVSATKDIDTITGTMTSDIHDSLTYNGGYHVSCYGEDDGELYVVGGGTDHVPFTYQWYGPNGFNSTNDSIFDLVAGTYSVTVLDSNGCSVNNSFDITTPDELTYTTIGVFRNESCDGSCNGQIEIDLTGGTSPYVGVSTNVSTGVQLTSTMIGDSILGDICSGTWSVVLTDDNGCSSSLIAGGVGIQTVGHNNQTTSQINQSTVQNILCYGTSTGSLDVLSPNPNTTNYSYNWVHALTGTSVGVGNTATNLSAGFYVLEAQYMDGLNVGPYDGCTTRDTIEITQIDEIEITAVIEDVDCYDNNTGSITIAAPLGGVTGGTPNYTFQWNPGSTSGSTINNLTEGTYTLSVTDINGCLQVDTFVVMEPDVLVANVTQNGATLTVNVTGGTTSYTHSWRESSNPNLNLQGGTTYMVLTPGTYYCIVTDANLCETTSNSFTYTSPPPPPPPPPTSIDESKIILEIYPNPFVDRTTVDFGRLIIEGELKVIDILGNVVDVYKLKNQRELVIERETKSKGVYFVELNINNHKIFKKITLQ